MHTAGPTAAEYPLTAACGLRAARIQGLPAKGCRYLIGGTPVSGVAGRAIGRGLGGRGIVTKGVGVERPETHRHDTPPRPHTRHASQCSTHSCVSYVRLPEGHTPPRIDVCLEPARRTHLIDSSPTSHMSEHHLDRWCAEVLLMMRQATAMPSTTQGTVHRYLLRGHPPASRHHNAL